MEILISKSLSIFLLGVIATVSLMTFFKVPKGLEKAVENISSAESKIDSSLSIIISQRAFLDSIIVINEGLLKELDTIKASNSGFSTSINKKLKTAQSYLWTIKTNIDKLPRTFPEPN